MKLLKLLKPDKNRVSIMIYVILTVVLSYAAISLLASSGDIFNYIKNILNQLYNWITPVLIGIIIAYLMFPVVTFIFRYISKPKWMSDTLSKYLSILIAYLGIIALVIGFFYAIYISIGGQISNNTNFDQIIQFINQFALNDNPHDNAKKVNEIINQSGLSLGSGIVEKIGEFILQFRQWLYSLISGLGSAIMSWSEKIFSFTIGLILSIYLIKDAEYFLTLGRRIYYVILGNSKLGYNIKIIFSTFDKTFRKYIKGQIIEAFFVALLSVTLLGIFGIKYAILIGIISGLTNMIPYVGPIIGTILAGVMGILNGSISQSVIGIILMIVVQQIDNNILAPKIVGGLVGLHPVFIIIALIVGGKFGGIAGMVLAIPFAASVKILFNMWYDRTGKDEEWTIFKRNFDKDEEFLDKEIDQEFVIKKPMDTKHIKIINDIITKTKIKHKKSSKNTDFNNTDKNNKK